MDNWLNHIVKNVKRNNPQIVEPIKDEGCHINAKQIAINSLLTSITLAAMFYATIRLIQTYLDNSLQ